MGIGKRAGRKDEQRDGMDISLCTDGFVEQIDDIMVMGIRYDFASPLTY
jgi:hypothetical protein